MFSAYNYAPTDYFYHNTLNPYVTKGSELYEEHKKSVQDCLSDYISPKGIINGSALRENWFATKEMDVFISHSHKDINKVKAFAGWLHEKFGLTAFIDSCAWGYCDDLLKEIDNKYCYQKAKKTYDYNLRNYTTSHVHMMLSTALIETMNRSECVIFFNTPNSITMSDELALIDKRQKDKTTSPWIMYELTMIPKIKRTQPNRLSHILEHAGTYTARDSKNSLIINYDVSTIISSIPALSEENMKKWEQQHTLSPHNHPLDLLYKITQPELLKR